MSATKNYKFGPKNNWRRWQWNAIVERLDCPIKDAIVLYLPGSRDLDRPIARSHGFADQNLIAVEIDKENLINLRKSGRLVIDANILDIPFAWPVNGPKVSGFVMDLCGGLTEKVLVGLVLAMCAPAVASSVFAVNLLRGRDPWSNHLRSRIPEAWDRSIDPSGDGLKYALKHRGTQLIAAIAERIMQIKNLDDSYVEIIKPLLIENTVFNSYRSNGLVFDSVVFVNPFVRLPDGCENDLGKFFKSGRFEPWHDNTKRHIAAILAHRTRGHGSGIYETPDQIELFVR